MMHPQSTRECSCCGNPFTPKRPEQRFCSRRCANTAPLEPVARFWSMVIDSGECRFFRGMAEKHGQFWLSHTEWVSAHRYAWELANGPIPEGLYVLHTCPGGDNPGCVEITHLRLGTHAENMQDRNERGRTAKGDKAGPRTHPENLRRGDNHPARLHPERLPHGERQHLAKMTEQGVREMRQLATEGATFKELGVRFGISASSAHSIVARKTWKHVA